MKKNFTRASVLATMAALAMGNLQAKDLYLSPNGDDGNSGLTADAPRKTLTNLTSILERGDVINISGILHMQTEYDLAVANNRLSKGNCGHFYKEGNQNGFQLKVDNSAWADITFRGQNPEADGFDGDFAWRFFELGIETNAGKWISGDVEGDQAGKVFTNFENLRFQNGVAPTEGGTFYIHDHIVANFDNCVFTGNGFDETLLTPVTEGAMECYNPEDGKTAERGGAIHFQFGKLTIKNSIFTFNSARRGGAICQTGGDLVLEDCYFENNGANAFDKPCQRVEGGALCLWTLHQSSKVDINRCSFMGNSAWVRGGAIYAFTNVDGADRIIDANITNCFFGFNDAIWEHGGGVAIYQRDGNGNGTKHILMKLGNCLFTGNTSGFYGPQLFWNGGTEGSLLNLTNCSMIAGGSNGNRGETNAGHGANICFDGDAAHPANAISVEIFNTIMEGNQCGNGQYSDISFLNEHAKSIADMKIEHSAVSRIAGDENGIVKSATSILNYADDKENNAPCFHEDAAALSGGLLYNGYAWGAAPINPDSEAGNLGDKQYYVKADKESEKIVTNNGSNWTIRGFDISATDMNGKTRGDKAIVGANEIDVDHLYDIVDGGGEITDYYTPPTTGIDEITAVNGKLRMNIAHGIVTATDTTVFSAYTLKGVKVAQAKGALDLNGLSAGAYVIVARDGAGFAVAKVAR
ncbi:hypothetical protein EEL35_01920 [Muribaculaceae bacterium Isolate-042 (Harlan)]|uniref:hypothetical protein n=1 Tax=Muribaculum intestinale TaxID=1796646 RepID=UPI000F483F93|nr:hypothetical protein [Muribaculum intestinale]ROS82666.1 hypothetical protein EEL35_01920 [Muribaculaceae bacterium Isolate-042 (Harlan)]